MNSTQEQAGVSQTTNLVMPTPLEAEGITFKQVALGKNHAAAVTDNGKLLTWGNPDEGKLGHAPKVETEEEKKKKFELYKKKGYSPRNYAEKNEIDFVNGALESKKVAQVACGFQHTAVITEDGEVYTWGHGKSGALGHGNWDQVTLPKKVENLSNIVKIECGIDFTLCMDKDGKLYSWGSNRYGQLCVPGQTTIKLNKPTQIHLPHAVGKVANFTAGEEHCALLNDKGEVFTWGYGNDGQLGHADRQNLNQPRKLNFDQKIERVVCGGGHTGIITEGGQLYLFGRGRDGQLGRGGEVESIAAYRTEPKRVNSLQKEHNVLVEEIALGSNHCLALAVKKI